MWKQNYVSPHMRSGNCIHTKSLYITSIVLQCHEGNTGFLWNNPYERPHQYHYKLNEFLASESYQWISGTYDNCNLS